MKKPTKRTKGKPAKPKATKKLVPDPVKDIPPGMSVSALIDIAEKPAIPLRFAPIVPPSPVHVYDGLLEARKLSPTQTVPVSGDMGLPTSSAVISSGLTITATGQVAFPQSEPWVTVLPRTVPRYEHIPPMPPAPDPSLFDSEDIVPVLLTIGAVACLIVVAAIVYHNIGAF